MSINQYQGQLNRAQTAIANLQREKSRASDKLAKAAVRAGKAQEAAARATNSSTLRSKLQESERAQKDAANAQKKIAGIESKISTEQKKLTKAQADLASVQKKENEKRIRAEGIRVKNQAVEFKSLTNQVSAHQQAIDSLSRVPEEISILFIAANPVDQSQLRLDEEMRSVNELVRKSEHRDSIRLESRWAARPLDLLQAMNEVQPAILHVSGHGSDANELIFQDDLGNTNPVSQAAFAQMIAASSTGAKLVFLNSCHSAGIAETICDSIPAAIGMNDEIGDKAAEIFAAQFYSAIGFGLSLERAFNQAKAALLLEGIGGEEIPQLFLADGLDAAEVFLVTPKK